MLYALRRVEVAVPCGMIVEPRGGLRCRFFCRFMVDRFCGYGMIRYRFRRNGGGRGSLLLGGRFYMARVLRRVEVTAPGGSPRR